MENTKSISVHTEIPGALSVQCHVGSQHCVVRRRHLCDVAVPLCLARRCALRLRLRVCLLSLSRVMSCSDVATCSSLAPPVRCFARADQVIRIMARPDQHCKQHLPGTGHQARPLSGSSDHTEACLFLFGIIARWACGQGFGRLWNMGCAVHEARHLCLDGACPALPQPTRPRRRCSLHPHACALPSPRAALAVGSRGSLRLCADPASAAALLSCLRAWAGRAEQL